MSIASTASPITPAITINPMRTPNPEVTELLSSSAVIECVCVCVYKQQYDQFLIPVMKTVEF